MSRASLLSHPIWVALGVLSVSACTHRQAPRAGVATTGGTGSTAADAGSNASGGATASCPAGQIDCAGTCVILSSNNAHCGQCNQKCNTGTACVEGVCKCQASLTSCDNVCVDLANDNAHCGSCTTGCETGQACAQGKCSCGGGLTGCPTGCTDVTIDAQNCGACGTQCQTGQLCQQGTCRCQNGLVACGAACVDTQGDSAHCGSCTVVCPTGQVCFQGVCQTGSCPTGQTQCGTNCVDLSSSVLHCGQCSQACPSGQPCVGGVCSCASGLTQCLGQCVNTSNNAAHCGGCSKACGAGQVCTSGACTCGAGQTLCGTQCVNLATDPLNCGRCATACSGGQTCASGACTCPTAGEQFCNGSCVNTQTDPANCGACVNQCAVGATCTAGVCSGGTTGVSCGDQSYSDPYTPGYTQAGPVLAQVTTQLGSMSLTDKANQMRGTSFGNPALPQYGDTFRTLDTANIRGFKFRDGPRGLNLAAPFENGLPGRYSTVFPVAMARGASFDLDLELRVGQAIGDETLAASQTLMLAPTINLLRHPAWGRAQETYGEDPYLLGRMGSAFVVGTQQYIPACAKHYAANNIENGRGDANAQMDEQTLREIYARHFEMVIKDGGVACIMASYNLVNGKHATQNTHLLNDILRTDFGFKGFVMSDWWAMPNGQNAGTDPNLLKATAAEAVKAGLDMELPWAFNYGQLESITGAGLALALTDVNQATSRILEQKLRFNVGLKTGGLGLKPPTTTYTNGSIGNDTAHIELAYQAALKSMVLLKNSNATLPIQRTKYTKLAVIGANVSYSVSDGANPYGGQINFASDVCTGDLGSSRAFHDPAKGVGPLAGIQAAAGSGITVVTGSSAAAVGDAGFVVVVAGLTPQDEGEEYTAAGDRASFGLDAKTGGAAQNNLITSVAALGKPMVVVLQGGSVIDMPWLEQVPAVVMAWYPGMVGGRALGQLLFGDAVFSGKLPLTWPTGWSQEPTFNSGTTTQMGYDVGYRYFDRNGLTPLYPFGHGLSYTTFEYRRIQLACTDVTKNGVVDVQVNVANTGTVAGDEIVFLFVSYPNTTARRPIKELKGFARVSLTPGQEKQVTIPLRISDLKYFDQTTSSWVVETGDIQIKVGPSSASLPLEATLPVR